MRGKASTPALLALAAALAAGLAVAGIPPVLVAFLGIVLVIGAIAIFSVPTDELAFAAVALLVLFITWNGFRLGHLALASPMLVPAFGAVVGHLLARRKSPAIPPWLLAAALCFVAAAMINIIFPPRGSLINETLIHYRTDLRPRAPGFIAPRSDLLTLAQFLVGLVIVPVMIAVVATSRARINRLIDAWTAGVAINGAVGLVQFVTGTTRAEGLTIHPNYLGLTCAIAVPFALLWVNRGGRWSLPGFVALALILGGEYTSGSRSGAVAALAAVVVTVAALPRLRRGLGITLPAAGIAAVAVMAFTPVGSSVLSQLRFGGDQQTQISTHGSDEARGSLHATALDQFSARPMQGVGFGVIEDAHNIYLQLLAAGGILAAIAFLVFTGGVLDTWIRAIRAGPVRDIAWVIGISWVVYLANGVYTAQLADKYLYVVPGLLLATSYVAAGLAGRTPAVGAAVDLRRAAPVGGAPASAPATAMVAADPQVAR